MGGAPFPIVQGKSENTLIVVEISHTITQGNNTGVPNILTVFTGGLFALKFETNKKGDHFE
jgi:hypothetical protein